MPLLIHLTTRAGELKLQYLTCYTDIGKKGGTWFHEICIKHPQQVLENFTKLRTSLLADLFTLTGLFFSNEKRAFLTDGNEKEILKAVSKEIKIRAAATN